MTVWKRVPNVRTHTKAFGHVRIITNVVVNAFFLCSSRPELLDSGRDEQRKNAFRISRSEHVRARSERVHHDVRYYANVSKRVCMRSYVRNTFLHGHSFGTCFLTVRLGLRVILLRTTNCR